VVGLSAAKQIRTRRWSNLAATKHKLLVQLNKIKLYFYIRGKLTADELDNLVIRVLVCQLA
jgi:hypothetical protein